MKKKNEYITIKNQLQIMKKKQGDFLYSNIETFSCIGK